MADSHGSTLLRLKRLFALAVLHHYHSSTYLLSSRPLHVRLGSSGPDQRGNKNRPPVAAVTSIPGPNHSLNTTLSAPTHISAISLPRLPPIPGIRQCGIMASRPRRTAAAKASEVISVHAKWADSTDRSDRAAPMSSRRSGRTTGAAASPEAMAAKPAPTKLRATRGVNRPEQFEGGEIVTGKRNRGTKKSYVVDSSPDEFEEEDEEAEIDDDEDDDMEELGDEDAEGDDMVVTQPADVDAEGEEDADGDIDMDAARPVAPTIKISQPSRTRPAARPSASKVVMDDDDDDDSLSDPDDSDAEDQTMGFGDETMADDDEDAEGEEIEGAGDDDDEEDEEDAEGEDVDPVGIRAPGEGLGSDEDGDDAAEPDPAKMTKRQRARFEDEPQEYMKLSDGKTLDTDTCNGTNTSHRGASQKGLYSRGTVHATSGDGPPPTKPQR